MVDVAQLVRVSVCGTEGRGFEPRLPPQNKKGLVKTRPFLFSNKLFMNKYCMFLCLEFQLNLP